MFRCIVWILSLATFALYGTSGHVVVPMTNEQLTEEVHKLEDLLKDLPGEVDELKTAVESVVERLDDVHPAVTRCPDGWIRFQSSCYGVGTEEVTWGAAQEICGRFGGGLVEIDNSAENEFVKELARSRGYDVLWMGATDAFSDGHWVWASSGRVVSEGFTDWYPGQQTGNDGGSQDCVATWRTCSDYRWCDGNCNDTHRFVCETRFLSFFPNDFIC
ncbi:hypothetical protein BaRGS_00025647 [Batillaria attramentaria]|uniref:C-type lectin domain-containing protein n=1 Tax=Batillaria attramentaria TaxID=370345 RepID=A0ABD0K767_9CAEN